MKPKAIRTPPKPYVALMPNLRSVHAGNMLARPVDSANNVKPRPAFVQLQDKSTIMNDKTTPRDVNVEPFIKKKIALTIANIPQRSTADGPFVITLSLFTALLHFP